ncbi:unnamed protein product [Onchocerca ochengi]|uniref:BTB domain-containing protein n=1 Tax=Onchocerca ochengi TaxID=42157 RepID=A0A182EBZ2_ONCOC|nr:unnamed protein product [Onchocerca ochengi]
MIAINTYAQFSVQITQLSLQESEECISKQAYYDIENNYIAIISMDIKCDELLINAFEKAINTPENLEIQIINNPQDYENILRVVCCLQYVFTLITEEQYAFERTKARHWDCVCDVIGVVWCDVVWCDVAWYGVMHCGVV